MKVNRIRVRTQHVQINPWAAGQRSFGRTTRPISSSAIIPHTITYTGISGAAGHSFRCSAPVSKGAHKCEANGHF